MNKSFEFAGFNFPRSIVELPHGTRSARIAAATMHCACGPYRHAPVPMRGGAHPGKDIYHEGDALGRWQYADEVIGLRHTGWIVDGDSDTKFRGIVILLPHGRALSGWTMGEGMAAQINGELFQDREAAAHDADESARIAAERESEFQERWYAAQDCADDRDAADTLIRASLSDIRALWPARRVQRVREMIRACISTVRDARIERDTLQDRLAGEFADCY